MSQTVLALVQDFCGEVGLPVPSALIGSTDRDVIQYRGIINNICRELSQYVWQEQSVRATFTSIASENQGLLTTLFGSDYRGLIQGSVWDETDKRPIFGPIGDASWEMYKAFVNPGPIYQYRIEKGAFLVNPALPVGHRIGAVYLTDSTVIDNSLTTRKPFPTADTDFFLIPDPVVYGFFTWKWKKTKGEPWQDDWLKGFDLLNKAIVKDANKPVLQLDMSLPIVRPGIWVPIGGIAP